VIDSSHRSYNSRSNLRRVELEEQTRYDRMCFICVSHLVHACMCWLALFVWLQQLPYVCFAFVQHTPAIGARMAPE